MEEDIEQVKQRDEKTDSSDGGSSSEEEDLLSDEGEDDALVQKLEAALAQNPYSFQDHVEYIRVLRKSSMLEKLREAREAMSSIFPLSPRMWEEWTQDEARLLSSDEDAAAVEKLYERGLQDYLSVPLWLGYLEFKRQHDQDVAQCSSVGIAKMHGLYERALASASLHFTEGFKIWAAYRQYEIDLLHNLQNATEEAKGKQTNCIRNLYRRQLSVPLCNTTTTLIEYTEWESQQGIRIGDDSNELAGLPSNVATAYRKAVQMCGQRERLEEKISREKPKDMELLQNFLLYIAVEEGTGDPARAQVLYERSVAEFPITHDLWLKYTDYLEKNLKVSAIILFVYARAVRNCPWTQALWSRYLLALERSNSSESDISKVFEQSLHSGFAFSTPEEYLEYYLTRADGLRRRICVLADETDKQTYLGSLRETFNQAAQFLSTYFPDFMDRSLRLYSYWGQLEASLANDVIAARGVWENLIKSSGWMLEVWKGYIAMEIHLGNLAEARTIYKRCYSRRLEGNGTEVLCEAWLRFEREHGSLEDYDRALTKVTPRLAEVKQLQKQQDAKIAIAAGRDVKEPEKSLKKKAVATGLEQKKRNFKDMDASKEKKSRKRPRLLAADDAKGTEGERIRSMENVAANVTDNAAASHEGSAVQAKPESRERWYTDQCTAFVSRLALEVNENDLREFFAHCGGLKDVRLMRDRKTGTSRGFAYADFETDEGLLAAISTNNQKLKGLKVKVMRSDPALVGKKGAAGPGSHDGHHRGGANNSSARETFDDKDDPRSGTGQHHDMKKQNNQGEFSVDKRRTDPNQGRLSAMLASHRRGHVQLSGKNTFAVPRAIVRPLGFSQQGHPKEEKQEEALKSNQEFRKMLLKE